MISDPGRGAKSKLDVPGSGGVGGNPLVGLVTNAMRSGVDGCVPFDPADILRCGSRLGDVADAFSAVLSKSAMRSEIEGREGLGGDSLCIFGNTE